ncbi:N-6 DNA methylase [Fulvivirgaceae bacterium PWU4]|uniref:site-specific DNA-methyltransferase (adenine-specific) n=1 Tax=Chryseosolibacter histidini TaxID=2782349 RepID=A0AAP2DQZ7_9BACT|nr:N-6 DNA methylase [Chryseosolibacter histidini]MBT1699632.1 N-6 DNA methylase [Chryseosolibacter histidini]
MTNESLENIQEIHFNRSDRAIAEILELLRKELSHEKYTVLLFLFVLVKDGLIVKTGKPLRSTKDFNEELSLSIDGAKVNAEVFGQIHRLYEPTIASLKPDTLGKIIDLLHRAIEALEVTGIPESFDKILYNLVESQGRFGGEAVQPIELTRFICTLSAPQPDATIYNPFAGLASFAVFMDQGQPYFGQEINLSTWAVGILRIIAHERPGTSVYTAGDSIANWNPKSQKYSLILSNPPFAYRLQHPIRSDFGTLNTCEQFLLVKGVQDLKEDGKLILLMSSGVLHHTGTEFNIRKYLVDNDLVEDVITFPGGLLSNTGIPVALIVINKAKVIKGSVRFINASKFVEISNGRKRLKDYALNSVLRTGNSEIQRLVANESIKELNYNLNVNRYFQRDYIGVSLDEVVSRVRSRRPPSGAIGKFVRIRDLKEDSQNYRLNIQEIQPLPLPAGANQVLESTILLALRWKTLKPTYFEYTGEPIYTSPDIAALTVDTTKVDIDFLFHELNSEVVAEQLGALRVGETIPSIRFEDLMSVKIQLPSIEHQRARVQGTRDAFLAVKRRELEEEALRYGLDKRLFSEFSSLKHTLGSPLQNILSNASVLLKYFKDDKNPSVKNIVDDFQKNLGEDLRDVLGSIKGDSNLIGDLLDKGEQAFDFDNYDLGIWDLSQIENEILALRNARFKFKIQVNKLILSQKDYFGIWGNPLLLQMMINNILDNADKYGFTDKAPENLVVIDLSVSEEEFVLQIKNNGKPFPKGYDKEKFITKYVTSDPHRGSGIGGYDINRIAEFLNSKWDLILNEDKLFPVEFKFNFPLVVNT